MFIQSQTEPTAQLKDQLLVSGVQTQTKEPRLMSSVLTLSQSKLNVLVMVSGTLTQGIYVAYVNKERLLMMVGAAPCSFSHYAITCMLLYNNIADTSDVSSIAIGVSLSAVVCLVFLGTAAGVLTVITMKRKTGRCKTDSSIVTAFSMSYR